MRCRGLSACVQGHGRIRASAARGANAATGELKQIMHAAATAQAIDCPGKPALVARNPQSRRHYLRAALRQVPRLLASIDPHPWRATYGCMDRQFWHYRTSCFPSQMYQEGVLPLALVYTLRVPGNCWFAQPRVRELAIAALRFAARSSHRDGSCDDYYPLERALGAAVFSLVAATEAMRLLEVDDAALRAWVARRAAWVARHGESGRLANHHALAALGLLRAGLLLDDDAWLQAADERLRMLVSWQSDEGWFPEYGGADPGYQTVTIDCLAKYAQRRSGPELDDALRRAVAFCRPWLHPDGSYGGHYGSRGTQHFYPHGMELLAARDAAAADLADGFLHALAAGTHAQLDDDRLYVHRLGNLLEAYRDWSPHRPDPTAPPPGTSAGVSASRVIAVQGTRTAAVPRPAEGSSLLQATWLPQAQLLAVRSPASYTVVSAARGGVFKHFARDASGAMRHLSSDAGVVLELHDGRRASSQWHDAQGNAELRRCGALELTVSRALCLERHETATPLTQAALHLGMVSVGRWARTWVRRVLQRRTITARRRLPIGLTRRCQWLVADDRRAVVFRVCDTLELRAARLRVRRVAFAGEYEAAYVAAAAAYQHGLLQPWTELPADDVQRLNAQRRIELVRQWRCELPESSDS
jgi:hypothetical protein